MKKIIFIILFLPTLCFAQEKITEQERLTIENKNLKYRDISWQIESMKLHLNEMAQDYNKYFDELKKKYNKNDDYLLDIKNGEFKKK